MQQPTTAMRQPHEPFFVTKPTRDYKFVKKWLSYLRWKSLIFGDIEFCYPSATPAASPPPPETRANPWRTVIHCVPLGSYTRKNTARIARNTTINSLSMPLSSSIPLPGKAATQFRSRRLRPQQGVAVVTEPRLAWRWWGLRGETSRRWWPRRGRRRGGGGEEGGRDCIGNGGGWEWGALLEFCAPAGVCGYLGLRTG